MQSTSYTERKKKPKSVLCGSGVSSSLTVSRTPLPPLLLGNLELLAIKRKAGLYPKLVFMPVPISTHF